MKNTARTKKDKNMKIKSKQKRESKVATNNHKHTDDENLSNKSASSEDDSSHSVEHATDGDNSDNSDREFESDEDHDSSKETEDTDKPNYSSNPGWADAMQKILRTKKPKRKKAIAFSKAKKLSDIKPKEEKEIISFEIDGVKDEVKPDVKEETAKVSDKDDTHVKRRRKETHLGIRVKPSINDRERERMLQKIATKGVVQLFNAVRQQQLEIGEKLTQAGPLERKQEQALKNIDKRAFLDVLMGGTKSIAVDSTEPVNSEKVSSENKDDKMWTVLRDDFVMGVQMKNWDKDDDNNEDSSEPEEMDSDD